MYNNTMNDTATRNFSMWMVVAAACGAAAYAALYFLHPMTHLSLPLH